MVRAVSIGFYSTLPVIIIFGIKTSYTDFTSKKIYNRDVVLFLLIGLFVQLLTFLVAFLFTRETNHINFRILLNILINSSITLGTGIFFWIIGWLPAGDVKLLFAYAVNMPLHYYAVNADRLFPFFDCFVNAFLFAFIFIFIELLYSLRIRLKQFKWPKIKKLTRKNVETIGQVFITLLFMILVLSKARQLVSEYLSSVTKFDMFYIYVIIFILFNMLFKFFKNKLVFIVSICGIVGYISYKMIIGQFEVFRELLAFISIGFSIGMISMIFRAYLERTDKKEVPISALKEHMIPTTKSLKTLEKSLENSPKNSEKKENRGTSIKRIDSEGLDEDETELIKKHYPFEKIEVENTIPFAPFIFAGVLICFLLESNVLTKLINLLKGV